MGTTACSGDREGMSRGERAASMERHGGKSTMKVQASSTALTDVMQVLNSVSLRELCAKQRGVTVVSPRHSLQETIALLSDANILSAPVVQENRLVGFVDKWGIADTFAAGSVSPDKMKGRVTDAVPLTPAVSLPDNVSVAHALQLFAGRVHRLAVLRSGASDGTVVDGIVSQSDVVRVLCKHFGGALKTVGAKTIKSLGWKPHKAHSVSASSTVASALKSMSAHNVQHLAVVNGSGKLAGSFSASDLRNLDLKALKSFRGLSVTKFLKKYSPGNKVVTRTAQDRFKDVCQSFVDNKVHALFVVDKQGKPAGVITLTDIMNIAGGFSSIEAQKKKSNQILFKLPGTLHVDVVSANDVRAADPNGFSDPYVVVKHGRKKIFQSKIVKKSLSPVWNQEFKWRITEKEAFSSHPLRFQVWDDDGSLEPDYLGAASVTMPWILSGFGTGTYLRDLSDNNFVLETQGSIHLKFYYVPDKGAKFLSERDNDLDNMKRRAKK